MNKEWFSEDEKHLDFSANSPGRISSKNGTHFNSLEVQILQSKTIFLKLKSVAQNLKELDEIVWNTHRTVFKAFYTIRGTIRNPAAF